MRVEQYFAFECPECGKMTTLDMLGGMMARRCPECGAVLRGEPDATIQRVPAPTQGLHECFDCGHVFGYAAGFDNATDTPNCTNCGSDNVAEV